MKRAWLAFAFSLPLFLSGCASAPSVSRYAFPLPEAASAGEEDAFPAALEVAVSLPGYLAGESIALEMDDGSLRRARYHLWAEGMGSGIERYLRLALADRVEAEGRARLRVSIDRFHGTEDGDIYFRGSWRWTDDLDETRGGAASGRFELQGGLSDDGYGALVAAHATMLGRLAEQIAREVSDFRAD